MTRLAEALKRWVEALMRIEDRMPVVPDAEREIERWDAEDVAEYHRNHGGEAGPDAPHIEFDDEGGI